MDWIFARLGNHWPERFKFIDKLLSPISNVDYFGDEFLSSRSIGQGFHGDGISTDEK